MASLLTSAQREAFVRRVRVEMAKRGLTRTALADVAGCKERTLGNLLAGQPVRDATIAGIARGLAIDLDTLLGARAGGPAQAPEKQDHADESYGGYLLSAYEDYLGAYVAYRRVFSRRLELYRSVYELDWDEDLVAPALPRTAACGVRQRRGEWYGRRKPARRRRLHQPAYRDAPAPDDIPGRAPARDAQSLPAR